MLYIKRLGLITTVLSFFYLVACTSQPSSTEDIEVYESSKNDESSYHQEPLESEKASQYLNEITSEVESLYLRDEFEAAENLAENLLRLSSNTVEPYYWLTRIKLALGDYQQAYNLASQGLNFANNAAIKRELQHLLHQAQMGNN